MNYTKVIFDYPHKNKNGIQMLAYKPYSSNPGDSFLFVTLCYWPRDFENEWIVYNFNAENQLFFQGRYFLDKNRAYADFLEQGEFKFDINYFIDKDAIELSAVEIQFHEDGNITYEHGFVDGEPNMYSVYAHSTNGSVENISDHKTYQDALQMALYLSNRFVLRLDNFATKEKQING